MHHLNFQTLLDKVQAIIQTWSVRSLTVLGKISVINALFLSQFVSKLLCTNSQEENQLIQFKKLVTEFLWDKKWPKKAYSKLIQSFGKGGRKLADLYTNKKAVRLMAQLIKFYKFYYLLYLNKRWLNSQ